MERKTISAEESVEELKAILERRGVVLTPQTLLAFKVGLRFGKVGAAFSEEKQTASERILDMLIERYTA